MTTLALTAKHPSAWKSHSFIYLCHGNGEWSQVRWTTLFHVGCSLFIVYYRETLLPSHRERPHRDLFQQSVGVLQKFGSWGFCIVRPLRHACRACCMSSMAPVFWAARKHLSQCRQPCFSRRCCSFWWRCARTCCRCGGCASWWLWRCACAAVPSCPPPTLWWRDTKQTRDGSRHETCRKRRRLVFCLLWCWNLEEFLGVNMPFTFGLDSSKWWDCTWSNSSPTRIWPDTPDEEKKTWCPTNK